MKILIRDALTSDAAAIAEIYVASWQATYANTIPESLLETLSADELTPQWVEKIESETEAVYVAEHDGAIIGFARLGDNNDEDLKDEKLDTVELHNLYFHPSTVRQGLGSQMWGVLEESLIGKLVVLWVLDNNLAASHFYIKHGFEQDLIEGQYNWNDQSFPKVRFRKLVE